MRGPIFAESDRIVGIDVDHMAIHYARQPDRRPHVVGKDEERRAVWDDPASQRHSVHDRAHTVLAYSEMEIAPGVVLGRKTGLALDDGVGRAGKIGGSADQLG